MTPENKLWGQVLWLAVLDAFPKTVRDGTRDYMLAAWSWIGTHPSKDFRQICTRAGMDPDAVHDRLIVLMKKTPAERAAFGAKIRANDGI